MKGLALLFQAIAIVESGGNDQAVGDKDLADKAYGRYQIRQPVCTDYNKAHGTNYRAEMMLGNRALSVKVLSGYLEIYCTEERLGRKPTFEDYARMVNGGPNGHRKASTLGYWKKVKRAMEELEKKPPVPKKAKKKKKK